MRNAKYERAVFLWMQFADLPMELRYIHVDWILANCQCLRKDISRLKKIAPPGGSILKDLEPAYSRDALAAHREDIFEE